MDTATEQKMRAVSSGNGVSFAPCDAIEPNQQRRTIAGQSSEYLARAFSEIELPAAIDVIESAISESSLPVCGAQALDESKRRSA